MIQSTFETGSSSSDPAEQTAPVAAAMMTVTFVLAALGGAALAGLQSLFS
jgi:TRAP-type mannitol/chloroaromatic compound transport system permease small subunit